MLSLHCTAQCLKQTHRNCSKSNVMSMSIYNNSTFSPSVVWHRCGGKLPGHYNSTVSVSSISLHVTEHLSTCLLEQSSWQTTSSSDPGYSGVLTITHVNHINILEYTVHFRAYTDLRNQGVTNTGWMIHTIISCGGMLSVIAKFKDYMKFIHVPLIAMTHWV